MTIVVKNNLKCYREREIFWVEGIRDSRLEDGSLSNLRSAGHLDLEESASHHDPQNVVAM